MLKVKRAGLGFPALFFYLLRTIVHFQQEDLQLEQLFTQEAGQQVAGSPDPEVPRTIVRYPTPDNPDPIRFTGDLPA